jgi:hypothetical protein
MKTKSLKYVFLASAMASTSTIAAPSLFEDFSDSISLDKYWAMEESIELDPVTQKLLVSAKGRAFERKSRDNDLVLVDTSVATLQANLSVSSVSLSNPDAQQALLGISGTFYNSESVSPSTELGEVFVRVAIGDRGTGLEAWYEMQVSTADDWSNGTISEASLGPVDLNTEYTASISYDGDNTFTVQFDNGPAIVFDGPPRMGPAFSDYRAISNRIRFGQDNSTPTLYDSMQDIGEPASILGTVDDVVTEAGLLDDFSGANLNQAIWASDETTVMVVDDALEMKVTGQGEQQTERFWIKQKGLDSFGATVTLLSSSTLDKATRFRGRLAHYLSNDTYDVASGDTPNGWEGFVWTQFMLERSDGKNRAVAYAERAKDADWNTSDELFWIEVSTSINLDQPYDLLIEKTGTLVEYKLDGVVVHSFDLATDHGAFLSGNDFEPVGDVESGLHTRLQNDAGLAHVRYDNIVTDYVPPVVSLQAFNTANDMVAYPALPIVHESEQIDLVADVSNPAMVSNYAWEQTGGMDVVISSRFAGRTVGNDSNLSFTVPPGSNNETLSFELIVLDEAGVEIARPFSMRVDNSAPATFVATAGEPGSGDSSGNSSGGGAFNPFAIPVLIGLLGLALRRRGGGTDA